MLAYIILTGGPCMFIFSYANSYNRLSEEKIVPVRLTVTDTSAELDILGQAYSLDISGVSSGSKLCLAAYLLSPDELRMLLPAVFSLFTP